MVNPVNKIFVLIFAILILISIHSVCIQYEIKTGQAWLRTGMLLILLSLVLNLFICGIVSG